MEWRIHGQMGNKGALIRFDAALSPQFVQFTAVPHPPIKPMAYATNLGMMGL
jgi:serine/threonine-protein phosphatase 5